MLYCPETKQPVCLHDQSHLDIQLAIQLERRLQSQMLRSIRIHICGNEMQLFGQVASWHEKQQAQETARSIAPMYRIRNELRVRQFDCGLSIPNQ